FSNVLASMGTAITSKQANILKKLSRNMVLALDSDAAGEEATIRIISYENTFDVEVRFAILPKGKDPDDVISENAQAWQNLVAKALPVVDYTFKIDESLSTARLLPIVAKIENNLRRDRYITKLAKLTGIPYDKLEDAANALRVGQKVKRPKSETAARALQPLHSSPLEEYCLALLLRHPEIKAQELLAEYFENSENREIFVVFQKSNEPESIKAKLAPAIWEHLDALLYKEMPPSHIEEKYIDCVRRLKERFLRSKATEREAALASEAEAGGNLAELIKLEEEGIEIATELKEVFKQKAKRGVRDR
ncbi:toprim domain-containing protein, partial [Chloroflexota bacterium]